MVDNARKKMRPKHAGNLKRVELNEEIALTCDDADQILAITEALDKLSAEDAQKAELVKLRYFAGLTLQQVADALGIPLWKNQVAKGDRSIPVNCNKGSSISTSLALI